MQEQQKCWLDLGQVQPKVSQSAVRRALPASGTKAALPAADATTKTTERMGMEAISASLQRFTR